MRAKLGEAFDGMLRVDVVPRDAVIIQEGEHLCATFLEPFLVIVGQFGQEILRSHRIQESTYSRFMLTQVSALKAVAVHCLDYCSQQNSKLLSDAFEVCVQW